MQGEALPSTYQQLQGYMLHQLKRQQGWRVVHLSNSAAGDLQSLGQGLEGEQVSGRAREVGTSRNQPLSLSSAVKCSTQEQCTDHSEW